jgi:hypothetical protein
VLIPVLALSNCATQRALEDRGREPNPEIKSCEVLYDKIRFRDQFFSALKGRARLLLKKEEVDVDLLLAEPRQLRAEVVGPLGIRVALVQLNDRWASIYLPRAQKLKRIPTAELEKNSARRDRFLRDVGLPIFPEIFVEAALSRVGLWRGRAIPGACAFDPAQGAYWFSWEAEKRLIWVHPTLFVPLRVEYFEGRFPGTPIEGRRPTWVVEYSEFKGEGPSTLPLRLKGSFASQKAFELVWKEAEIAKNLDSKVFDWAPRGEFQIEEY